MSKRNYQAASFGGRATEGAYRDRASYGTPDFAKKEPMSPRGRLLLLVAIAAGVIGLVAGASSLDWEELYRGKGYVPWRMTQKHAVAACRKYGKHLVILTVDSKSPAKDVFRRRVLVDKEVQRLSAGFIWYLEELSPGEVASARAEQDDPKAPFAPTVVVMAWELETVLVEPQDASTISVRAFQKMLKEGLEINATPDQVDPL